MTTTPHNKCLIHSKLTARTYQVQIRETVTGRTDCLCSPGSLPQSVEPRFCVIHVGSASLALEFCMSWRKDVLIVLGVHHPRLVEISLAWILAYREVSRCTMTMASLLIPSFAHQPCDHLTAREMDNKKTLCFPLQLCREHTWSPYQC